MMAESTDATLQVEGKNVKGESAQKSQVDLHQRDPNDINVNLKVEFDEIIGEPNPSVFSFDNVWVTSERVFFVVKLWCYRILSLLCAVPAMVCWGIHFACLSFCVIWCYNPAIRSFQIEMECLKKIYTAIINCFVKPCFEAMGHCFYNFRITQVKS